MINELIPFLSALWLTVGVGGIFYFIDKFKIHLNFLVAFLVALLGIGIVFGIMVLFVNFLDSICLKCYRYSPKFVWSYGYTGSRKHLCEKCDPSRIKEVFGDNLSYLEHLARKKKLI